MKEFTNIANIKILKCPLAIWFLIALYEALLLFNVLIYNPPWEMIISDMAGYLERAQWIAWGEFDHIYTTFYPQGTQYIFAVFFKVFDYFTAQYLIAIFQTICISLALYFLYRLTTELFKSVVAGYVAVIAIMLYRAVFALSNFYLSENIYYAFLIFLMWAVYNICFKQDKKYKTYQIILAGFISGYAALVRPQILIGLLIMGVYLLIVQNKAFFRKQVIIFGLFFIIPIGLQSVYTSSLLGRPSLFTAGSGYEFYKGVSGYESVCSRSQYGSWVFSNNNFIFDNTITGHITHDYALWDNENWKREAKKLLKENPKKHYGHIFKNLFVVWRPVNIWPVRWRDTSPMAKWFVPIKGYIWLIYPFALIGLFFAIRKRYWDQMVLLIPPVLGVMITCALRCGEPRFMLPFMWMVVMLASFGYAVIINKLFKLPEKGTEETPEERTKKTVLYSLLGWGFICLYIPIQVWLIKSKDPDPTWWDAQLPATEYTTLSSINPAYVRGGGGMVRNGKLLGGDLTVNGRSYKNGFFAHGSTIMKYELKDDYDYIAAEIGVDQNARPNGQVTFKIWADGKLVFPDYGNPYSNVNVKYGGENTSFIQAKITGCKLLTLETIGGPKGNRHNHGVWGAPVLWKE